MKKIISLLICLTFVLLSASLVYATDTYTIESEGIKISLPDTMYVFDRNTSPDDERIQNLGLTYDALMSSFNSQDIYLDAMDTDNFNEIVVIVQPTDETNYFELKSAELYNAVLSEEKNLKDQGREIVKSDLFEAGNVDFVMTVSMANDAQIQYTTVYNGKKIKIKFIDFNSELTSAESDGFEEIAESVIFTDAPNVSKEEKDVPKDDPITDVPIKDETKSNEMVDKLGKVLIIILVAVIICTIPALIFRFVLSGGGIRSRGGAKAFAFFYSVLMALLYYYILTKHSELNLSIFISVIPLVWSFVIYKIVKK